MAEQTIARRSDESRRLSGTLGVPAIVFMVVAAAAPLTVIAGVVPIGFAYGDGAGFPAMFAVVGGILLVFAVGFNVMTRHVPKPGAFFTYVAHGLGRPAGLAAAYAAILCYLSIEVAVLGYIGYATDDGIVQAGGPHVHWAVYSFALAAVVAWFGFRHIDLSSRVLGLLLSAEIAIVMLISLVILAKGGASGIDLESFKPSVVTSGAPSLGLMFAMASFIGFEATAIFRDEAKDPQRTIPRATFAAVIAVGVFYTFTSWALVLALGSQDVSAKAAENPLFLFSTAKSELGTFGEVATHVLLISSIFAAALAFHNVIVRYLHALSNAGLLPGFLSEKHERHGSPSSASVTTAVVSAAALLVCLLAGLDPYLKIFTWFVGLGSLIYILLLAACSLSVLVYFRGGKGESPATVVLAPLLALAGLAVGGFITIKHFPLLVGDYDAQGAERFGSLSLGLLAAVVAVAAAGVVQALVLRARGSAAYDHIIDASID